MQVTSLAYLVKAIENEEKKVCRNWPQMGRKFPFLVDITYPFISYFTGHAFNSVIERFFQDFDIMVSKHRTAQPGPNVIKRCNLKVFVIH